MPDGNAAHMPTSFSSVTHGSSFPSLCSHFSRLLGYVLPHPSKRCPCPEEQARGGREDAAFWGKDTTSTGFVCFSPSHPPCPALGMIHVHLQIHHHCRPHWCPQMPPLLPTHVDPHGVIHVHVSNCITTAKPTGAPRCPYSPVMLSAASDPLPHGISLTLRVGHLSRGGGDFSPCDTFPCTGMSGPSNRIRIPDCGERQRSPTLPCPVPNQFGKWLHGAAG